METAIRKWSYGRYNSDNYGGHTQAIQIGNLTLYFSYDTVVGFKEAGHLAKISENVWTVTTGKHLNWLEPDKSNRIANDLFTFELVDVLKTHNLTV